MRPGTGSAIVGPLCAGGTGERSLGLTRYRVTVEALEPLALPAYLGSTLRGAFGHAFRALTCPARPDETCPIRERCPYHLVFETAPPPDATALRTHEEIPMATSSTPQSGGSDGCRSTGTTWSWR